jgi:[protein-PII] uridylyltransferase
MMSGVKSRYNDRNSGGGSLEAKTVRGEYELRMGDIRKEFERTGDGLVAIAARTALVDELTLALWAAEVEADPKLTQGVAVAAVGGYGRKQLFPYSDIDLLFVAEKNDAATRAKDAIRRVSQGLWDCGLRVAPVTRAVGECERFDSSNPEFGLALLDFRGLGGDAKVIEKMTTKCLPRLIKDTKAITAELGTLSRERHTKYGNTLFHLEPSIKDCPGGLRDAHVAEWLRRVTAAKTGEAPSAVPEEFVEAETFLAAVRCFLHYRYERDDNTLDWRSQDAAAENGIGLSTDGVKRRMDASYWMRAYFRNARAVERRLVRECEVAGVKLQPGVVPKAVKVAANAGFRVKDGRISLAKLTAQGQDPAQEPEVVLDAFAVMSASGMKLDPESEERIGEAIPLLGAHLEEGPGLWRQLAAVLTGERAAMALRSMHALGVLDLILPEFHGIDALVIRDAYHRYTVDEHTFVLIETLHGLKQAPEAGAPDWRRAFHAMANDLQNPELLYLAALLHDTGKARAGEEHATASGVMAEQVLARWEMDAYDASTVLWLIRDHLEMSAALRRDIFDAETVRAFAGKVHTQELLRMLTLFTYADIHAVHPDALTPWKAENLWRLSMATANHLDRSVDEDRVHGLAAGGGEIRVSGMRRKDDRVARFLALARGHEAEAERFLEGFPGRYLDTRSPEAIFRNFELTLKFEEEPFQITFRHGKNVSEITLVTRDRPRLFAGMAAALAAWGMNVLTADAFANGEGVVVDNFRFTDMFRTLELNASERERFVESVRELVAGRASVEKMLNSRRRAKRKAPRVEVETRIDFDDTASSHSTLLQVVAQDVPGLLRAISATISRLGHSVEVALIDTEGETAFDVYYLTSNGGLLDAAQKAELAQALREAIDENAQ